jgi:hypothetical protein
MISVTAKIGVPFSKETSSEKQNSIAALIAEYKQTGKIVGDFILVDDNTIEIRFIDVPSAENFTEAVINLYEQYSDTIEIQEIKIV